MNRKLQAISLLYLLVLSLVITFRSPIQLGVASTSTFELIPFYTLYIGYNSHFSMNFLIDVCKLLLNMTLFIPFGIIAKITNKSKIQMFIQAILYASFIETLQIVASIYFGQAGGIMSTDTIMFRLLGVCLGYYLYKRTVHSQTDTTC